VTTTSTFDPFEELDATIVSVEASAGTGKTYTLANLATLFLAQGRVTSSELLLVTFTRAASGELRSRVRARIAEAVAHLASVTAGSASAEVDQFLRGLGTSEAGDDLIELRFERLERALREFDSATITTIHGFSAQVLGSLGVGAGVPSDVTFVEDQDRLLYEVCSDVMIRASVDPTLECGLPKWDTFLKCVKFASCSSDLEVTPTLDDVEASADERLFARLVRESVELLRLRRESDGTQSFDDMLDRLWAALGGGSPHGARSGATPSSDGAGASIRARYRIALIDEFQDTDPIQWKVFSRIFGGGAAGAAVNGIGPSTRLVLVGDPKQAIYSFRGADVRTYVDALHTSEGIERRTLSTNWRSDVAALKANSVLFDGATFGDGIPFNPVGAPAHGDRVEGVLMQGGGLLPALDIRCGVEPELFDAKGAVSAPPAWDAVFGDLVAHAVDLLTNGSVPHGEKGPEGPARRRVRPNDIAVLVRSNSKALEVQSRLIEAGVPAVLARGSSVLDTPAAAHLRYLLEAMVRPADQRRARTFALSWFGGWSVERLADADDAALVELQEKLHEWNAVLATKGVVELFRKVWDDTGVLARVLATPDGDRSATDLDHLGELLRSERGGVPLSAAGLLATLLDLDKVASAQADADHDTDRTSRRVESDDDAVQVMTVWVAKGLEFPIVLCPSLFTAPDLRLDFHDPDSGRQVFDVRQARSAREAIPESVRLAEAESMAEELRLLYVALTRAKHHTALWWIRNRDAPRSALARVLFLRDDAGVLLPRLAEAHDVKASLPDHHETLERLEPLASRSAGTLSVSSFGPAARPGPSWSDAPGGPVGGEPRAARFVRPEGHPLDRSRTRWSFSSVLTREQPGDPWDQSVQDAGADDEQRPPDTPDTTTDDVVAEGADPHLYTTSVELDGPVSALADLPAGAAFGTLAHDVLERVDFAADDLFDELSRVVGEQRRWRSLSLRPVGDPRPAGDPDPEADGSALLVEGLRGVVETPLGPSFALADGSARRLRDVPSTDRLDELSFDLNLGEGSESRGHASVVELGRVLQAVLPAEDPFLAWARGLADGLFDVELSGHLTGSIDAVLRLPGTERAADRFVVVDYKTNRLHERGTRPRPGDYGIDSMRQAMVEHHYPLQALLYLVALHRYLRWRLPDYDPDRNLGGAAYLFLRGMAGEATLVAGVSEGSDAAGPEGLFVWSPPTAVVSAASDLLAGLRAVAAEVPA
jgi:exodeoxyribonuclease V beta subunit